MKKLCIYSAFLLVVGCTTTNTDTLSTSNHTDSTDISTPVSVDNSSMTNSNDEAAAIQTMNDQNAQNASMAAAEQQNEAAQAQATQDEINGNAVVPLPYN